MMSDTSTTTIIDVEWRFGTPCPICKEIVNNYVDMMEHIDVHERSTGIIFMNGVLYTSIYNTSISTKKEEEK